MLKRLILISLTLFLIVPTSYTILSDDSSVDSHTAVNSVDYDSYISWFYEKMGHESEKPGFEAFRKAITGYFTLKAKQKVDNNLLTVIDFSLSSTNERLWIIDMDKISVVHRSLVSHGQNSGELFATRFSNTPSSYQSSLGFFITGDIYYGKHGMSLFLNGMEQGINDKARERAIVMHSADYVSYDFINQHGRLGRSHGCPAIPLSDHTKIISLLSGGSCLFIYHTDSSYHTKTELFKQDEALAGIEKFLAESPVFLASISEVPFIPSLVNGSL